MLFSSFRDTERHEDILGVLCLQLFEEKDVLKSCLAIHGEINRVHCFVNCYYFAGTLL